MGEIIVPKYLDKGVRVHKFQGNRKYWYCKQCEVVVEIPEDPSIRCDTCRTPRDVPSESGPPVLEHSIHGSYFRPKYNEGLGKWINSERERVREADKVGAVPKHATVSIYR